MKIFNAINSVAVNFYSKATSYLHVPSALSHASATFAVAALSAMQQISPTLASLTSYSLACLNRSSRELQKGHYKYALITFVLGTTALTTSVCQAQMIFASQKTEEQKDRERFGRNIVEQAARINLAIDMGKVCELTCNEVNIVPGTGKEGQHRPISQQVCDISLQKEYVNRGEFYLRSISSFGDQGLYDLRTEKGPLLLQNYVDDY